MGLRSVDPTKRRVADPPSCVRIFSDRENHQINKLRITKIKRLKIPRSRFFVCGRYFRRGTRVSSLRIKNSNFIIKCRFVWLHSTACLLTMTLSITKRCPKNKCNRMFGFLQVPNVWGQPVMNQLVSTQMTTFLNLSQAG